MRVCYLASDPRIQFAAPTGYGSHIRKTIAALEQQGIKVMPIIAGDQKDISRTRNAYRKIGRSSSRWVRLLTSIARDLHEIADDHFSTFRYGSLLAGTPCDFIYERMAPFRTAGLRLAK